MLNLKLRRIYIILLLIFSFWFVFAHNPRIVWDRESRQDYPILVESPEASQAFYWELRWESDFYQITSNTGFLLYLSLTVPAISWSRQDYSMLVKDGLWNILTTIDWKDSQWWAFYEKFAWDLYYQWPEFQREVSSWVYYIQIYNSDNIWKYALAVWKLEVRPVYEIWNTFKDLPALKTYFFEKSLFTIFFNYIGIFVLILIVFIISFFILLNTLIKKFKS